MSKKLLFVLGIALMLCQGTMNAQVVDTSARWTYMGGAKTIQSAGTYGTRGTGATTNIPAGRYNCVSWTDKQGNFWLFGGILNPSAGLYYNDMWRYEPATSKWTWFRGLSTYNQSKSVRGSKGQFADSYTPGARATSAHWVDKDGNLWLYGGNGYGDNSTTTASTVGRLGDLWKYDVTLNQWAWMGGTVNTNQAAVYGQVTVTDPANYPGGRQTCAVWVDAAGDFWMFGGNGMGTSAAAGNMNDLWKYDPVADRWTWMSGLTTTGQYGTYTTPGTAATTNLPGARDGAIGWTDASGNLWLFGGAGLTSSTAGSTANRLNDLWKYNTANGEWTWMTGKNSVTATDLIAVYGTRGVPATTNTPGGRSNQAEVWKDLLGNFWLFGGYGFATSTTTLGMLNDIWKYDPVANTWTYIRGATTTASTGPVSVYGTQYVQAWGNTPGARGQTGTWRDTAGNVWIFGGQGFPSTTSANSINDFWLLSPPPCGTSITATTPLTFCQGDSVVLKSSMINTAATYEWYNGATLVGTDSQYVAKTAGSYTVKYTNVCTGTSPVVTVAVNTLPAITVSPATAVICTGNDTALTAAGGASYTWLPTTFTGSGATVRANPTALTTYTVTGTDANGCKNTATRTVTVNSLPNVTISPATAAVCTGKDTALTGGGAATYTWLPNTYSGSGATVRANPTALTTYTVTGTDANGCTNTATRQVAVNALPNISITPAIAVICSGKDTALTGNGGTTYTWLPNTYSGSGATVRANPTALTTYTVTGTDANGCTNTATRSVSVNTLPLVGITPAAAAVCNGKDTALTATGGVSYVWLPNTYTGSGATIRATPTALTTYTVTGTDANGCSSATTRTVTVNALPTVSITGVAPVCANSTLSLTGNPASGTWSSGTTANATINTSGVVTGVAAGTSLITYSYTDGNKCTAADSKTVTVNALPAVPAPITGKTDLCIGDTTTLYSTTAGGAWSSGTPGIATINNSNGKVNGVAIGTTLITYTVTNLNTNCSNSVNTNLNVRGLPAVPPAITGASHVCVGAMEQLSNTITGGVWSSSDLNVLSVSSSTGQVTGVGAGMASVKYTINNTYSCKSDITTTMTVYNNLVATITPSGQVGFCDGDSIMLVTQTTQGMSYQWLNGQAISGATAASYNTKAAGYYQVAVMDANGCKDTSDIDTVVMYPLPTPTITRNGQVLSTDTGYASYQWYANGQMVNGATQRSCIVTQTGQYYVVVTDSNGCTKASAIITVTVGIAGVNGYGAADIVIYPNPAQEIVYVKADRDVHITLAGMDGKVLIEENNTTSINIGKLASAMYLIRVYDANGTLLKAEKLVKTY